MIVRYFNIFNYNYNYLSIYNNSKAYKVSDLLNFENKLFIQTPARFDEWQLYHYKFWKWSFYNIRWGWKKKLNRRSRNMRYNFYGMLEDRLPDNRKKFNRNVKRSNFIGKRWKYSVFYHLIRKYKLFRITNKLYLKKKDDLKNLYWYKQLKKRYSTSTLKGKGLKRRRSRRREKFYYLANLKKYIMFKKRFNFFKNYKVKSKIFLFNLKNVLYVQKKVLFFKKNYFFSFTRLMSNIKKKAVVSKFKLIHLNVKNLEYHASHVQLNFFLQSGIFLGSPSLQHLRFPNFYYRSKLFSNVYLQYLLAV